MPTYYTEDSYSTSPDFKARIRYLTPEEGGRKQLPCQGIRSDFKYQNREWNKSQHEGREVDMMFMIPPLFIDEMGRIQEMDTPLETYETLAYFYIIVATMREFHRGKIQPGTKFYTVEGSRITADGEVLEVYF